MYKTVGASGVELGMPVFVLSASASESCQAANCISLELQPGCSAATWQLNRPLSTLEANLNFARTVPYKAVEKFDDRRTCVLAVA